MKFHHFWLPLAKTFWLPLKKSTVGHHPGENPSDVHASNLTFS